MATTKKEYLRITTPRGSAHYPRLNKPETEVDGKPVKPRYKCGILLTEEQVKPIREKLEAKLKETVAAFKAKFPKKAKSISTYLPIRQAKDKDGNEIEELYLITAKTQAQYEDEKTGEITKRSVPVFDSVGRPVKPVPNIGTGSEIKMAFNVGAYDKPDRDKTEIGLTLYLDGVQLLKLEEYQGGATAQSMGFGAEDDGFKAEDAPAADSEESEDSEDESSDESEGSETESDADKY